MGASPCFRRNGECCSGFSFVDINHLSHTLLEPLLKTVNRLDLEHDASERTKAAGAGAVAVAAGVCAPVGAGVAAARAGGSAGAGVTSAGAGETGAGAVAVSAGAGEAAPSHPTARTSIIEAIPISPAYSAFLRFMYYSRVIARRP